MVALVVAGIAPVWPGPRAPGLGATLLVVVAGGGLWVAGDARRRAPGGRLAAVTVLVLVVVLVARVGEALRGLDAPPAGSVEAWATLLDDPRPLGPGVVVTVVVAGRHLRATAHGPAARSLADRLAGERIAIRGRVRPLGPDDPLRWRHVVGRLVVDEIVAAAPAGPLYRAANAVRRTLVRGARVLGPDRAPLFGGMVIGDDRGQSPVTADDFRAAGLGHLLVVSGQNVVFVLALAAPVTSRLRPGTRLLVVLTVLVAFCVLTRFEPSVLRAVTMAGLATGAAVLGGATDGRRALSGAVVLLVVVDPFLVRVLAFQLSALASAGIVWLGPWLEAHLRGPRPLRGALAATGGAQLAVAPLLVATFGSVPLWSLPANLLADPAAGPVMMWGATAGVVAGLGPSWWASVLHLPTRALLWWIGGVAHLAAVAPPARVGVTGLVAGSAVLALWAWRRPRAASAVMAVLFVSVAATARPAGEEAVGAGVRLWRSGDASVVVLEQPASPARVLAFVREAGGGAPALVVAGRGGRRDADVVAALRSRYGEIPVLAPRGHRVPRARIARSGQRLAVGPLVVVVDDVGTDRLAVRLSSPGAGEPPVRSDRGGGGSR